MSYSYRTKNVYTPPLIRGRKASTVTEEIRHRPLLFIIGGMGVLLAFAIVIEATSPSADIIHDSSLHILPVPAGAEKYPAVGEPVTCATELSPILDGSSKIRYDIMTPKLLPEGYSLQGVDIIRNDGTDMVTLYYWDKPLCNITNKLDGGPALNGAVVVRIANSLKVPDIYAQMIESVNKLIPDSDFQKLVIKGIPAIGNSPSIGLSGGSVQDALPYPARIFVITDNVLYNIEANMPLEDLVKIVESMR
jgi:hypothetical protein